MAQLIVRNLDDALVPRLKRRARSSISGAASTAALEANRVEHPKSVYVRVDAVLPRLDGWLGACTARSACACATNLTGGVCSSSAARTLGDRAEGRVGGGT